MSAPHANPCPHGEIACAFALGVLPTNEAAAAEAHIAGCSDCQCELESLQTVFDGFVAWPTDVLRPPASLKDRLVSRINDGLGGANPERLYAPRGSEPEWLTVATGIECKVLAKDARRRRVSMLVRLAPAASYPAHTHADFEELYLLDGELSIDNRTLVPGDYNYGAPGHTDHIVRSETGCTCLLITSTEDVLS